ncbi:MAG TPA: hypothetical protein PLC15_20295 [Candidatus Obscuribacter sp.]|nr:hypothetical protein [Candidatus Obscuribacter sp.]HNB17737.1 hypothetical protein [Candidatus Obscuribacter sp.]HND66827.1 hypothetical protein [Candidatus Obscuribacter sp.]HNN61716.1 hypothetical protein [Candidatus Obscuribacter sp.]
MKLSGNSWIAPLAVSVLLINSRAGAAASDWGYEGDSEKPAAVRPTTPTKPVESKPVPLKPQPKTAGTVKALSDLDSWLEIFALIASSPEDDDRNAVRKLETLSPELKENLSRFIKSKLDAKVPVYQGISPLWQEIRAKVDHSIDYKESYRMLFRALTRHWLLKTDKAASFDGKTATALALTMEDSQKNATPPAKPQAPAPKLDATGESEELFTELIGPSRIAEPGNPPLTDDAIKAYSDMTCFLYAKKHPDKSVDQDDNRLIFAGVVRDKFINAPSAQAKLAMSNFDLTWASFRCRYLDSSPAEKERMSITVSAPVKASSGDSTASLTNQTILNLFSKGPWAEGLAKTRTAAK